MRDNWINNKNVNYPFFLVIIILNASVYTLMLLKHFLDCLSLGRFQFRKVIFATKMKIFKK